MKISDIANWASIIGFIISILTLFTTFRVNRKVNNALKEQEDLSFFSKRVLGSIKNLIIIKSFAEQDDYKNSFGTKQYSQVKSAIGLVNNSWNVLCTYEGKWSKWLIKEKWKRKFKKICIMYNDPYNRSCKKLVDFLTEFIAFLEKEKGK